MPNLFLRKKWVSCSCPDLGFYIILKLGFTFKSLLFFSIFFLIYRQIRILLTLVCWQWVKKFHYCNQDLISLKFKIFFVGTMEKIPKANFNGTPSN